ncbi:MAG: PBP1A family penicillin-binding protein, partial [Patescibacteria group bacterium]|nr:PBP1A family penicillin-binding protein [Patescibacteria group bacterium]
MPIPQLRNKNQNFSNKRIIVPKKVSGWKKPKNKKDFLKSLLKKTIFLCFILFFLGLIAGVGVIAWYSKDLPDPNRLIERNIPLSTKIFDRSGKTVLYEIHGDEKRNFVDIDEIPYYAIQATIAMEDKNFFEHKGFSLLGIFRGVVIAKLQGKRMQGGSTITQQLIKNAILTNERKIQRKIKELILAWKIEKKFSKEEILQLYFNEIPYGSTAYGIESASNLYFGKSAQDITLAESAILAALPQAPTYYSPYGSHKDKLIGRQQYILKLMLEQNRIDQQQHEEALAEKLEFKARRENIIAPHFVMYIKEKLSKKYGEKMVEQGGLQVITTLDTYKQEKAEEAITEFAEKNEEKYNAKNSALVAVDAKTGQILAMVGSRDYFDIENDGNVNVAVRLRQPGSSLKPLVYATAFTMGYTPETILYDTKTNFGVQGAKEYIPHNYDGKFRGPVTMKKSLAGSLNVSAVKTLYLTGLDRVTDNTKKMGYTTLSDKNRFGLSLVLGGGEIKLLEHTNAYAVFARDGIYHPIVGILEVKNSDGEIIEKYVEKEKRVMDSQSVRLLNSILSDNSARAYAFGESNYLNLGARPVCAKTGTTNDYKDAWTIGYTPSLAVGVWTGNNRGEEMKKGAGGSAVAAPIWNKFMKSVLGSIDTGEPVENFAKPKEIKTEKSVLKGKTGEDITLKIDKFSNKLATDQTPEAAIIEKTFKQMHSILFYVNKDDPQGENPEHPENDPQYNRWEESIIEWAEEQNEKEDSPAGGEKEKIIIEIPPIEYDDLHIPENIPSLSILNLDEGQKITNDEIFIDVDAVAPRGMDKVEYWVDQNLIDTIDSEPYDLHWIINDTPNGKRNLKVIAYDDVLNSKEINLNLNFQIIDKPLQIIWISPDNNQNIFKNNFPFNLSVSLSRISRIKKLDFYFKEASQSSGNLISSIIKPKQKALNIIWNNMPNRDGFYKIYLVITDVNDKK